MTAPARPSRHRGIALLWLGCALSLAACGGRSDDGAVAASLPAGQTLALESRQVADMKAVVAQVATRDQAQALARIPGTLTSLSVREGDVVRKGQQLAMVVDSRLGHEAGAHEALVAAAQAEATRAAAELARIRELFDHGVYAQARLDQAQAQADAAAAQLVAAKAQGSASASAVAQGAVLAPADGQVLRADVPAGSVVVPGMSIATLTVGPPVLRLMLPESVAGQVQVGAKVLVQDASLPAGTHEGSVVQVYPAVANGQVRVDATLAGLSTQFIGRRLAASIAIGVRDALVVPRRFVATRHGVDQVQVVTDGRLGMVPVQLAPLPDPDEVEVLSGVGAGDVLFVATEAGGP